MKGLDLNAGFVSWVGNISPDDAVILKLLRNAGCVFYARTTQPQTLMHLETSNNIYGKHHSFEISDNTVAKYTQRFLGITVSNSMAERIVRATWLPCEFSLDRLSFPLLLLEIC